MIDKIRTAALVAAMAVGATTASAATVSETLSPSSFFTSAQNVAAGETFTYTFTASSPLRVLDELSAAATGTNGDLRDNAQIGLNSGLSSFASVTTTDGSARATSAFAGFNLAKDESFTFTFDNTGGENVIGTSLSFTTAPVPVPAAGLLLLTLMAGGGALARRKAKKAV